MLPKPARDMVVTIVGDSTRPTLGSNTKKQQQMDMYNAQMCKISKNKK